ncbi:MAG: hypothetical protein ACJ8FY_09445 [Gemmataceae bacterium]
MRMALGLGRMAAESPAGCQKWRIYVGWSAVAFNLIVSWLWVFWGAVETFHEGWYYGLLGLHLMWNLASFGPVLIAILLGLLGLRWPRLGGLAYFLLGGICGFWLLFGGPTTWPRVGFPLAVLMTGGCGVIGLLFWFGQPRPRRLAYHLTWSLPVAVALVSGAISVAMLSISFHGGSGEMERTIWQT